MANEISYLSKLTLKNARNKISRTPASIQIDQTGDNFYGPIKVDLDGTYQSVGKGDIGTARLVALFNPEADGGEDALVSFDGGSTTALAIPPGLMSVVPLHSGFTFTDLQFKAATSASSVEVTTLEA